MYRLGHIEKRLGLGLERSRPRLEAKIEGLCLGKISEVLVLVSSRTNFQICWSHLGLERKGLIYIPAAMGNWTFHPFVSSPPGLFAPKTFRPVSVSVTEAYLC